MRHNESQVDSFIEWAKKLKVDTYTVVNPCVRNLLEGLCYLPKNKEAFGSMMKKHTIMVY